MKILSMLALAFLLAGCVAVEDKPMNFKFVTSGQAVVDAQTVVETLRGNSLKPLSPVNLRGSRTPDGDLLIQWTRRSRIGPGLRPGSSVPLAEELETYIVEIYDGATLKRTVQVFVDQGTPVIWEQVSGDPADVTIDNDGTATSSSGAVNLRSRQVVHGNFMLEVTIPTTGSYLLPYIGLDPNPVTPAFIWRINGETSTSVDTDSRGASFTTVATGDRISMEMRGATVQYYKNYSSRVTKPIYTSRQVAEQSRPFQIYCQFLIGANRQVVSPRLFTHLPESIYTEDAQTEDFGSPQSSIKVRVYQVSAIVGPGFYAETTL